MSFHNSNTGEALAVKRTAAALGLLIFIIEKLPLSPVLNGLETFFQLTRKTNQYAYYIRKKRCKR